MPEQRRLVTILFADVTGSTALGESLDPEDVRALMGRYFAHARRVVSDHGGTLEKFIGDAVMAVFGLTHAWGDDAERALAAALSLRDAIAGDVVLARWLTLRMGVNTGEVVAADDTSQGDFLITGDAVNVAARLEQHAVPGEILTSERTMMAARVAFTFGPAREIEAKGKSLPLKVYPLLARQARQMAARPPLVGRQRDLLQLDVLKERALEEGQQQMLTVFAPAGVGKTRLIEEFLARLDPGDGFRVAMMRCQPYGQTLTFAPLYALLTDLLGGEPTQERVEEILLAGGQSSDDAACMADSIVQPLSRDHEVADREAVAYALRLLIEALARIQPIIVIFEDLHWASDGLLDLIEPLTRPHAPAPLLLIALSRPELLERRPVWGGGRRNCALMTLQPLSDEQTRDLVSRLTEGMPDDMRTTIATRSAGNPFFTVELARALVERRARGEATAGESLPDTVHAAVQARLDLLTEEERALAEAASVVGQSFSAGLLRPLLPSWSSAAITSAVDRLLFCDLLAPAENGRFAFRHALICEVAYGTLARARRVRLHAALATWLDTQTGSGDGAVESADGGGADGSALELTAYHYLHAITLAHQSAVPLDAPIDDARAVAALERAGVRAGRVGAYAEAIAYLRAALSVAPPADHARLYERLGDNGGWGTSSRDAYQQALEQWRTNGPRDPLTGARLLRKALIFCFRVVTLGNLTPEQAAAYRAEAEQLVNQASDEDERWHLRVADLFMASALHGRTLVTVTMEDGMAAASYFEARGDWPSVSEALDGCAALAMSKNSLNDMLAVSLRRLSIQGLPAVERGDAVSTVVRVYIALGRFDESIATMQAEMARLKPGLSAVYLAEMFAGTAIAFWLTGRWAELDQLKKTLDDERYGSAEERASVRLGFSTGALPVALCREDSATAEEAFAVLERIVTPERLPNDAALIRLYKTGDSSDITLTVDSSQQFTAALWLILLHVCEYGLPLSAELLSAATLDEPASLPGAWRTLGMVAVALHENNWSQLATAISDAEASGLVPFAAHMRIVLAKRTGDATPLALARPVLESLGDRLFLRRLEAAAASCAAST